ncbi:MAG: Methionine aminopeptidase [Parcubacteria group bacterium GW2011_GWA1_47_11]|nr:MAG: Methionine aminopeptidase [Parcubacteria group bacterium GW2011_GWA1_47_11]
MEYVKTPEQVKKIRQSARILADVLRKLQKMARPGVNLLELEEFAQVSIREHGGKPAFLGYKPTGARKPYGYALCTSLNHVVVHGTPYSYALKEGDILSLDLGVDWQGGISDAALTVGVGQISKRDEELINITRRALENGIAQAKPGNTTGDIGRAIEETAKRAGAKVIDGLTGHGVGNELHEEPTIYNFGEPGEGELLEEGMVLALEPMICFTTSKIEQLSDDSYATMDGGNSVHFEHTILIGKERAEILSQ